MRCVMVPLVLAAMGLALAGCGKLGAKKTGPGLVDKGPFAGPLNAAGETPTWSLRIRDQALFFTGPDTQIVQFPNAGAEVSSDQAMWSATAKDGKTLKVTLAAKTCKDEATTIAYPMTAEVKAGDQTLTGCATKAGEGLGSRE